MITPRFAAAATPSGLFVKAMNAGGGLPELAAMPATPTLSSSGNLAAQGSAPVADLVSPGRSEEQSLRADGEGVCRKRAEWQEDSEESSSSEEELQDVASPSPQQELSSILLTSA